MTTKTTLRRTVLFLFLAVSLSATTNAQQQNQQEMMQAWSAYMTPGDMHSLLAKMDGNWTTEMSMWMDPNGQPLKATGECSNKMIMGGRYQQSDYKGNIMGQPMEGQGVTGYDNSKKLFESTWIDNMGSGIMKLQGSYDANSKTFTFKGTQTDFTSGTDMPIRETLRLVDDNTHVMEMYITPNGAAEFKTMEVKFTRKK